ncbi:MAG TPA: DISARM system helicase DrmA [Phycisphaerales bacterium]
MASSDTVVSTSTPAPSAVQVRGKLRGLILAELLGPQNGPTEEIAESRVSDRYLVGMLAPRNQPVGQEGDDSFEDAAEPEDSDDGKADPVRTRSDSLLPSSFGMTFVVASDATELEIEARWGIYDKVESETLTKKPRGKGAADNAGSESADEPALVWKREPKGGKRTIRLAKGPIAATAIDDSQPDVVVRGVVREDSGERTITLFIVNQQMVDKDTSRKDRYWLFQVELMVRDPAGRPVFLRKARQLAANDPNDDLRWEDRELEMLYRHDQEFAVGHGIATDWKVDPTNPWQAFEIRTVAIPSYEVRQQTPPTPTEPGYETLGGVELRMDALSALPTPELVGNLKPLADAYEAWIAAQEVKAKRPDERLQGYEDVVARSLGSCRDTCRRIREGIETITNNAQAADAFRFANRAMWQQRVHSIYSLGVRRHGDKAPKLADVDADPKNKSWRPFQLAFMLLNLPSITDLHHQDRSHPTQAIADLLWFPTGGGKTEAYLGLAAYTMGLRRLQGVIDGHPGYAGVSVLMRYTLRLLTLQQFQRASALLCAMETIRREALTNGDTRWGTAEQPFILGLWVGAKSTPNWTDDSKTVVDALRQGQQHTVGGKGSPKQLTNCPWCGTKISPRNLEVETVGSGRGRTFMFCDAPSCEFSKRNAPEGLPVLVVDEEIYRRLPTMLIATVDKFAQMPWNGLTEALFGRVQKLCPRHGFRTPDTEDADSHNARGAMLRAQSSAHPNLRPPDLIIQDELHLISGPLGSMVGLYETAIDELCSWHVAGKRVRPKVIASTATVRNAKSQIHELFGRRLNVFPPPGIDAGENFFSKRRETTEVPGRQYIGICAPGRSLKAALIRVFVAFLAAGAKLYDDHDTAADPWLTSVGYFNSLRELGGMRRMVGEDVRNRLRHMDKRGMATRILHRIEELTSRKQSTDIPNILDRLELQFSKSNDALREANAKAHLDPVPRPIDVMLATSMLSVGVDIDRLGLMIVGGQPKATSEYIQATSRVGRKHPGLVCTVYNWARPRDLSHYERFRHYHATFYQHVEALSVTPFAPRALDRGLSALLVSLVRLGNQRFNPNESARGVDGQPGFADVAIEAICRRVANIADPGLARSVEAALRNRADEWASRAQRTATLVYRRSGRDDVAVPLLQKPEEKDWQVFTCLNSLRDVEPSCDLVMIEDGARPRP